MGKSSTTRTVRRFSAHASLAALGVLLRQHDVFGPIREGVQNPPVGAGPR